MAPIKGINVMQVIRVEYWTTAKWIVKLLCETTLVSLNKIAKVMFLESHKINTFLFWYVLESIAGKSRVL